MDHRRGEILNVFAPNSETDDPTVFAGRRNEVLRLTDAFLVTKSIPVIYGDAGIGKTSLALQMARIALGDVTLLHEYGHQSRALYEDQQYTVFWMSCSDATRTTADVLQRLINTAECFTSLDDLGHRIGKVTETTKLSFKFFEESTTTEYETRRIGRFSELNVEDKFTATTDLLQDIGYKRLLFVIDELDRVADTTGFANFLKNASSASIKFLLVGIGHSITSLLIDHESIVRSLVPVKLWPMSPDELDRILQKATRRLATMGVSITFSHGGREKIVKTAGGFPWFVHVLAQAAMINVLDACEGTVAEHHIDAAIDSLASNTFAQHFADLYHEAVQGSTDREIILRLMAKWPVTDVIVKDVYALAEQLEVDEPAAYGAQLLQEEFGRTVVCPKGQRRIFRFRNAMFKRYCDIRASFHQRVQPAVDRIWLEANQ